MKAATLLCALGVAQLGLAAPVPTTVSDFVSHVNSEARRLTRITRVAMNHHRPAVVFQEEEDQKVEVRFDNRPMSPSTKVPPSIVLAAPRPLHTDYLQALAKHPTSRKGKVVDVVGDGTPETINPMSLREGLAELLPAGARLPCWKHLNLSKATTSAFEQHPDLVVLGGVIALVIILLVLETVGTTFQGVRKHYSPQGEIRLEIDEKASKTISFRCDTVAYDEEQDVAE
ncbi:hypothetical protein CCHL11_00608 [Colletotrichum chlorophyti]|uniref:Uncharacterized protein n=1 Tax=Colletotrichum chlorophyti TaxID=708187 RepID=A0A1Q8S4H0_9PEZI|nr:hypothetical protein CCHL11_00608 [Colletotrichum chlorophyti]